MDGDRWAVRTGRTGPEGSAAWWPPPPGPSAAPDAVPRRELRRGGRGPLAVRPLPLPLLPVDLLIHEAPHLRSAPAATPPASPFPGRERVPTLLEAGELPLAELAELARCEGQSSRPIYRVHRW